MKLEINKLKNLTYVTVSKTSILILFIQLIGCIKPDNEIGNIKRKHIITSKMMINKNYYLT